MLKVTYWSEDKKLYRLITSIGILTIPVILYLIPLEWLKNQQSICLFKNLIGNECYGCGMIRAIISAIHFQFVNAFQYNKLYIIVLPILIYIWATTLKNLWFGRNDPGNLHRYSKDTSGLIIQ